MELVRQHMLPVALVLVLAAAVNAAPYVVTGISPAYDQSSDTTVHVVDWRMFAQDYQGQFDHDRMFTNYPAQASGVHAAGKMLVAVGEALGVGVLEWSVIISYLALAVFLTGVYALVWYSTSSRLLALVLALVSIVPVISLGLSSWGFLARGFVPKELSLAVAVWLTLLYLYGVKTNSKRHVGAFFVLMGLGANFYPVLFFHYAMILLGAEVFRARAVRTEQFVYGLLFLFAAPVALYDVFVRSAQFAPPDPAIILDHYTETLRSWYYLLVHYLRKQIVYIVLVGVLWYVYRRVLGQEYPLTLQVWLCVWWSALLISLVGVGIELFAPLYAKYLLSRASVWFYFASMLLVGYMGYRICFEYIRETPIRLAGFAGLLGVILLGQTSIMHLAADYRGFIKGSQDYKNYLEVVTQLERFVPVDATVLSNPDREAQTLRAYGDRASYVSWKDGNVTLFDGNAARQWFARYQQTRAVFQQRDYPAIQEFSRQEGIEYYLYNVSDFDQPPAELQASALLQVGHYGLVRF
jgi:hypothetical protein